jgi:hypothetical protein
MFRVLGVWSAYPGITSRLPVIREELEGTDRKISSAMPNSRY